MESKELFYYDVDGSDSMSKSQYAEIISTFLQNISFEMPDLKYDTTMADRVEQYFKSQDFSSEFLEQVRAIFKWSSGIAITTYPFNSASIQELIGIYTAYAVIIDDLAKEFSPDLKSFNSRLLYGQTQGNNLLQSFAEFLARNCKLFGQFGGDMIIKGSLEFISACYFEVEQLQHLRFPSNAPDFPRYIRLKTGVAETYAFLAFPEDMIPEDPYLQDYLPSIPYLTEFFNYINDIFSFYKESATIEDSFNFIQNYAIAHNIGAVQSLQNLCTATSEIIRKIRAIFSTNPRIQNNIEQLLHGYVVYHLSQSRYRLSELGIPAAGEAGRRLNWGTGSIDEAETEAI